MINNETEIQKINRIMGASEVNSPSGFLMPFGKFMGRDISEVPLNYLQWIMNQDIAEDLIYKIEDELDRRDK